MTIGIGTIGVANGEGRPGLNAVVCDVATRSVYALPTCSRGVFSRSACLHAEIQPAPLKETVGAYKTAGANSGHVAVAQAVAITFGG